jgi:uncharacterized SAM-binding protein YcdF (DUF218 family)
MDSKSIKKGVGCLFFFFLGILMVLLLLMGLGAYLSVDDTVHPVDGIVVLSGDEGQRMIEAAGWYAKGYAEYLLITKTVDEEIGEDKSYSQKLMRIAIEQGVPQDAILFTETMADNTQEEAAAVLDVVKKRNIRSILIITDPYHTRRAKKIFDQVFQHQEVAVSIHALENSWYQPYSWFFSLEGWRQTIAEFGGLFVLSR